MPELPQSYALRHHPLIPFDPGCRVCPLGNNEGVAGAGPDDLSLVKLIVVSDHTGHHEAKNGYPFFNNDAERSPKRNPRTGKRSLMQFRNAGSMLRYALEDWLGLDSYQECYLTNAIKCNPQEVKPTDKHTKTCALQWLEKELLTLDQYCSEVPLLVAGRLAFKALQVLNPELASLPGGINHYRRTNHLRYRAHPLVCTFNPVAVARSEFRVEHEVSLDHRHSYTVQSVRVLEQFPGSPVFKFRQDLEFLRQYL